MPEPGKDFVTSVSATATVSSHLIAYASPDELLYLQLAKLTSISDLQEPHLVCIVVKQERAVQPAEPLGQGFAGVPEVATGLDMGSWRRQGMVPVQHQLWPAEQPWA